MTEETSCTTTSLFFFCQIIFTEMSGQGVSPGHTNARVQIIELGGTKSNLLVLLSVSRLNLQLQQLLLTSFHRCLFPLHQPDGKHTQKCQTVQDGKKKKKNPPDIWEHVTNLWRFPSSLFVVTCVNRSVGQHHVRTQMHQKKKRPFFLWDLRL